MSFGAGSPFQSQFLNQPSRYDTFDDPAFDVSSENPGKIEEPEETRKVRNDLIWLVIAALIFISVVSWAGVLNTALIRLLQGQKRKTVNSSSSEEERTYRLPEKRDEREDLLLQGGYAILITIITIALIFLLRPKSRRK